MIIGDVAPATITSWHAGTKCFIQFGIGRHDAGFSFQFHRELCLAHQASMYTGLHTCVQVWLALLQKGIPFDVVFIDLRNKPDWYESIVPTKLVPAVRLRDSGEVVYESADILKVRQRLNFGDILCWEPVSIMHAE